MKRNSRYRQIQPVAIAACVAELGNQAPTEILLIPAGEFRARDGRPGGGLKGWYLDAAGAARIIAGAQARAGDFPIDYEHQILLSEKNGQPAPAAGWYKQLAWRDGKGLYAVDVRWTERARAAIAAHEYRYISPVFAYDTKTGEVLAVDMASLTNFPALDGHSDLAAKAAARFLHTLPDKEEDTVDRTKLIALLGLAETATDAEIETALAALKAKGAETDGLKTEVAALKARTETPDPAKFVSIEAHTKLTTDFAALKGDLESRELNECIKAAIDDGRLPVAEETWARDFARQHGFAALKASLEKRPAIAALKGTQTGGKAPAGGGAGGDLDDTALAICKQLGVSVEDYKKTAAAA